MKDKTVSLMILNGELSDWYFLYPSGGADRGGVATPQIANDIAIGEDAFKNREDKPLAVTVLYHTIATKLQGAGFHTPQCQSGLSNWGGAGPRVANKNQSASWLTKPTAAGCAALPSSGETAGRDVGDISPRDRVAKPV
jgi:hypothetical protein